MWLRTGTHYRVQLQALTHTVRISGHKRNGQFTDMLATYSFPNFTVQRGDAGVPVFIYTRNSLVPISTGTSAWGSAVTRGLSTQVPGVYIDQAISAYFSVISNYQLVCRFTLHCQRYQQRLKISHKNNKLLGSVTYKINIWCQRLLKHAKVLPSYLEE